MDETGGHIKEWMCKTDLHRHMHQKAWAVGVWRVVAVAVVVVLEVVSIPLALTMVLSMALGLTAQHEVLSLEKRVSLLSSYLHSPSLHSLLHCPRGC